MMVTRACNLRKKLKTETNILKTQSKILKLVNGSSVGCCKKNNKLLF